MIIPQSIFSLKIPCSIFFDCSSLIELFKEINNLSLLLNNALLSSSLNEEIKDSSVFFGIFITFIIGESISLLFFLFSIYLEHFK